MNFKPIVFLSISVVTFFAIFSFKSNVTRKYPCENTSCLDSLVSMNDKAYLKDSVVVIYTFLACKPCQVLAQKVQKKCNSSKYTNRIIFLNNVDFDREKVKAYIASKEFSFPYLLTANPYFSGSYPLICYYGKKGELLKKTEGYGPFTVSEIKKFLE
jgi:hypothetical protein